MTKAKVKYDEVAARAVATDRGEDWGQRLWSFALPNGPGPDVVELHADTEEEARVLLATVLAARAES